MANETWNERGRGNGPADTGWRPVIETDREGFPVRYDQFREEGTRRTRGYGADVGAGIDTRRRRAFVETGERRLDTGREARIDYPDSELREAEWNDRREAYGREAERRQLVEREHDREIHETREDRQARREREEREHRETLQRRRRDIEHSVRRESTATLVRDLLGEAQFLAREELRLAKAELRDEAKKTGKIAGEAAGGVGVGGLLAFVGVLALTCAAIVGLAFLMPLWLSALLIGAVMLLVGGILAMGGLAKLKQLSAPTVDETTETLKEDREWASETMRGVRSRRRGHA
ncbi:phage holin family protein [Vulgatibacter sp.]|uniref:phage holin family protein n=1 Tax=Vulgatibacter sp. TaxID=1971226 RepID=UPI00356152D1